MCVSQRTKKRNIVVVVIANHTVCTYLLIESVAQLLNAAGDLVKMDRLSSSITFHHKERHGVALYLYDVMVGREKEARRLRFYDDKRREEMVESELVFGARRASAMLQ